MIRDAIIAQKDNQISALKEELLYVKQELSTLKKLIFGSKSERFRSEVNDNQLSLFAEDEDEQEAPVVQTQQITYKRKKVKHPGRNKIPEHLPVEEVIIEPEEDTAGMVRIGEEVSETLEYTPASLVKKRTIRPKYVDKKEDRIYIASLPSRPIPKSIAEASVLSHIMVSKYIDHLPLYRQAKIFNRDFGWKVSQSTMVDWVKASCELLEPLYDKLIKKVLDSTYIQVDESPIKVLERLPKKDNGPPKKIMQGYQWVYFNPENKLVYFDYCKGRGQHGPREVLSGYKGYVQCDGYKVYDIISRKHHSVHLLGCLVHARRYFDKALDSDHQRASHVLSIIQELYKQERKSQDLPFEQRQAARKEEIVPLLTQIKEYIHEESIRVLPKSPIGKAMLYFQNQYQKILAAARDARYRLDNNLIEDEIRPLALGRKNYLFAGSHEGGKRMAMLYSFFGSCKQQGINPRVWLKETLEKIGDYPINGIVELLPGYENHEA